MTDSPLQPIFPGKGNRGKLSSQSIFLKRNCFGQVDEFYQQIPDWFLVSKG